MKHFEKLIICLGILIRIFIFCLNPPNNSNDDHLELINKYSLNLKFKAEECWECYQPPLYYNITSNILDAAHNLKISKMGCWKAVQGFNLVLTILVLLLFYKLLVNEGIKPVYRILILSFWVAFPRDIMAFAMITNDYFLVFITTLILYWISVLLKLQPHSKKWWVYYILIVGLSSCGGLIKQSGLVLLVIPFLLTIKSFVVLPRKKFKFFTFLLFFVAVLISLSPEIKNHLLGYKFLVSNQDFFGSNPAQYPGKISEIEFFSLKIIELLKHPFLDTPTSYSFNTELFANGMYDYDRKFTFISDKSILSAQYSYIIGFLWVLFFMFVLIINYKKVTDKIRPDFFVNHFTISVFALCICLSFYFVPLLQTFRLPYSSSMKSQFLLPAIPALLLILAKAINYLNFNTKIVYVAVLLNVVLVGAIAWSFYEGLTYGLNEEHGAMLFKIPNLKTW
jgi:hypothetical protein